MKASQIARTLLEDDEDFDLLGELSNLPEVQWKIQFDTGAGWADLKSSEDGGPYEADLFPDERTALIEIRTMIKSQRAFHMQPFTYRAVRADEPEEADVYESQ